VKSKLAQLSNTGGISPEELSKKLGDMIENDAEFRIVSEKLGLLMQQQLTSFPFIKMISPLYDSILFILPISISTIVKHFIEHSRKLFKLYFAKVFFKIVLKESSDEIDKAKYFMTGLIWYNRFLKNTINLHINNIDIICEKVLIKSPLDNNRSLLSIAKSFANKDGFEPLR
jgi:hypothetical protein